MPVVSSIVDTSTWKKQKHLLMSLVLAVYSLPRVFFVAPTLWLDGSWIRALNMAVKNDLVFGADFIFTFGPLGFLSTRNTQYISSLLLLAGDLFLMAGFFYLAYQYLSRQKGWFFIVLFALFLFRNAEYSQSLFLLFMAYTLLSVQNKGSNWFEVVYCAGAGVLLFFIKINYGIISLFTLPAIAVLLLMVNRRALLFFVSSATLCFLLIWLCVHIDIRGYVMHSVPLIRYYNEAMFFPISTSDSEFIMGLLLIVIFLSLIVWGLVRETKETKRYTLTSVKATLLCITCYLFYKNGFTRADSVHYAYFFAIFPLFLIIAIFLFNGGRLAVLRVVAGAVTILSIAAFFTGKSRHKAINGRYIAGSVLPFDYFTGIFTRQPEDRHAMALPLKTVAAIGNTPVDVIPTKVALVQLNGLNYAPRPIPQSYSAYSPELDSLNADHFYGDQRPGFVFIRNGTIDNRYGAWDESLTKATLHLNYEYTGEALVKFNSVYDTHLLLRAKSKTPDYPRFEKIAERVISLDDMVRIHFPDSAAVYMTANVEYDVAGLIRSYLYQPPRLQVGLVVDSAGVRKFEALCPLIKEPVLISKYIGDNRDLANFLTGNLGMNRNIVAFGFHALDGGIKSHIVITFLKMVNY